MTLSFHHTAVFVAAHEAARPGHFGPRARHDGCVGLRAPLSDGVVTIRPPTPADVPLLVAGRDEEFRRFLGEGAPNPDPVACIVAGGAVVGWVDYDHDRAWLGPGEVNVGYNLFAAHRGRGYATRAVRLLLRHLAEDTACRVATLRIHPGNERSLGLARRAGFEPAGDIDGETFWKRPVAPGPAVEVGDWSLLEVESVVRLPSAATLRWWINGGRALALHLGRTRKSVGPTCGQGCLKPSSPARIRRGAPVLVGPSD